MPPILRFARAREKLNAVALAAGTQEADPRPHSVEPDHKGVILIHVGHESERCSEAGGKMPLLKDFRSDASRLVIKWRLRGRSDTG